MVDLGSIPGCVGSAWQCKLLHFKKAKEGYCGCAKGLLCKRGGLNLDSSGPRLKKNKTGMAACSWNPSAGTQWVKTGRQVDPRDQRPADVIETANSRSGKTTTTTTNHCL